MGGLAFLIPVALSLGALGLAAFFWAMRSGQFEDLDGAANRILIDEDNDEAPDLNESRSTPVEAEGNE